jgi:ankyrin repeat protein
MDQKNESNNEKMSFIESMPILKLKNLNIFWANSIKKKSSRNIFYNRKHLLKNNENTSILSDPSINIFYKSDYSPLVGHEATKEENTFISSQNNKFSSINHDNPNIKNKYFNNTFSSTINSNNFPKIKNYLLISNKKKDFNVIRGKRKNMISMKGKINIRYSDYKKRIKKINSSFSPESIYNIEKRIMKDFSSKNILYNNSLFSEYKTKNLSKIPRKKIDNIKLKYKSSKSKKINFNGKFFNNLKEFEFIVDPLPYGRTDKGQDISEKLKKMDKKVKQVLKKDNNKLFESYYSIIDKKKFIDQFRNPFIYDNDKKDKKEYNYINQNIINERLQLLKEMKEELNKDKKLKEPVIDNQNQLNINIKKKMLFEKFKENIIKIAQFLRQRKVSLNELKNFRIIKQSYTYGITKTLINYIKLKNFDLCFEIIDKNKYIVLDFDYYYLTPLHWAVKKNFYEFIPKLLDYGAKIDSLNFVADTPLSIAVKNCFYDSACILLYYLASPFIKDREGKKLIEATNNSDMKSLLKKAEKIHYLSYFQKTINKKDFIQNNLWTFIKEEFKDRLNFYVFSFIKEREIFKI